MTNINFVDRNLQTSAIISYGRGIVPYIFLTIDADSSLHFMRFNYHSFSVNVNLIFRTNAKVQKPHQNLDILLNLCDRQIDISWHVLFFHTKIKSAVVMDGTLGTGTFKLEKNLVFFQDKKSRYP